MRWSAGPCLFLVTLAVAVTAACTADKSAVSPPASTVPFTPPAAAIPAPEPEPEAVPVAAAARRPEPEPEPEPEPPPPPAAPRKVLILGDSLAATGFGVLLEKKLDAHPDIECARKAKSATGLARPDFYDWESEARKQVEARNPDLVVVILGGNDGQDLTPKSGKGKRVTWKSEGWHEAYKGRVADFLKEIGADEQRKVLWLGLPRSELNGFEQKLNIIRKVQVEAVADLGDAATYLETTPFLLDAKGELLATATVGKRKDQDLREDDGIHFTMAGSQFFADKVYPEVLRVLELEDIEPNTSARKK